MHLLCGVTENLEIDNSCKMQTKPLLSHSYILTFSASSILTLDLWQEQSTCSDLCRQNCAPDSIGQLLRDRENHTCTKNKCFGHCNHKWYLVTFIGCGFSRSIWCKTGVKILQASASSSLLTKCICDPTNTSKISRS